MAATVKFESKFTAHCCPECGSSLQVTPANIPEYAICPECAAISIFDPKKRFFRMLHTQEWLDVIVIPGYWDLLEGRQHVLERITAPGPKHDAGRTKNASRKRI